MTVSVTYVPALHQGYLKYFESIKKRADKHYLVDQSVIKLFPNLLREIRAIEPLVMVKLLQPVIPNIELIDIKALSELGNKTGLTILMPNEAISDFLKENYFTKSKVRFSQIFLRFDEKTVKTSRSEVPFTGQITRDDLQRHVFKNLRPLKLKSSDWFLQVAAALIQNNELKITGTNKRMPTAHASWILGDPRNFLPYGTDTHLRSVIHAEQALIAQAARAGIKTDQAVIYVTTFPCPDCGQLIAESGIKTVYFLDGFSQLSSLDTFKQYGIEIIKVTT